ncbi:double-stranded RNA-binding protein 2-like [Silene latifolia]|uniref:double-stranded RNA-binding protein 2-like n=1 Tax=Silene latifolia TaxID=37657 RepID=UPI003D76A84F
MYKNQLQELAQRSCFNLPSYACIREGPDHAPRFKATVNFNGETFESPNFFATLRQAEHAAAEVALNTLAKRGPSRTLAAKVLDETGVYKNLLQETAHRAGLNLPVYTTVRSGPGHVPVFSCTVELAGLAFTGELAKTKKQAQKNAAISAWYALKQMSQHDSSPSPPDPKCPEEQEQVIVARFLANLNSPDSSNLRQSNHQKGPSDPSPSSTFKPSFSSSPSYQSWASSDLTPDVAMHPVWLRQQAAEHQRRLMGLGISIPALPLPMQPAPWMLTPGVSIYTATSPLYLSNQIVPHPIKTRSMVTSQELQSERSVTSNNSDIGKQNGSTENTHEKELSEPASSRCTSSGVQTGAAKSKAQRNFRPRPTLNTPPRMRSGINSYPTRHLPGRMQAAGFHAPSMAPAVQIRSVVPVCSAPPPRKLPISGQDTRNPPTIDVSSTSSNLEDLHI